MTGIEVTIHRMDMSFSDCFNSAIRIYTTRKKKKKNIITCSYPTNHHKYFAEMKDSFKEHQGTKTIPKKHPSSYTINTTQYKIASLILTIITIVT